MLFHQLREHLVFQAQFALKLLDSTGQVRAFSLAVRGERSRPSLEKLLLPAVEYARLQIQFVAQIRHRYLVYQMTLQDRYLFIRTEVPAAPLLGTHHLPPSGV
jgi:hypothetical protein